MWQLYDDLIDLIPEDVKVEECLLGCHWILVRSKAVGIAMTPFEGSRRIRNAGNLKGMPLRELASYIKSWNFMEAALGSAALNSFINCPQSVKGLEGYIQSEDNINAFEYLKKQITGKKVAVIGHFPDLEELKDICKISILERRPSEGDFPDPACEYILPEQDYIFITGTTLANKTLPRLLQLGSNSEVILVGPSTPLAPILFDYGVDMLASTVVTDNASLWKTVQECGCREIFKCGGKMVKIHKPAKDHIYKVASSK